MAKGLKAYARAIELKPGQASYHNNYALALARPVAGCCSGAPHGACRGCSWP